MVYIAISDNTGTISQFARKERIKLNHSGALTAYQKKLTVPWRYLMQADFDDIRFVTDSGTHIPYWIESKTDSSTADVWIKNDYIDGDTYVWVYYGNNGLSSGSNGSDTFIQWHGATSSDYLDSAIVAPSNIIYESKSRNTAATHNVYYGVSNHATAGDDLIGIQDYSTSNLRYISCANDASFTKSSESPDLITNQWYKLKITLNGSKATGYADDDQIGGYITTNLPNENLGLWMHAFLGTCEQEWSFVRKYTATEPTYSIGAEEHQRRTPQFIN